MATQWKSSDGRQVYPKDMSLPILQNAIAMLERKASEHKDKQASQLFPIYDELTTELNKRSSLYEKSQIPVRP
jgi:hypothetical protein